MNLGKFEVVLNEGDSFLVFAGLLLLFFVFFIIYVRVERYSDSFSQLKLIYGVKFTPNNLSWHTEYTSPILLGKKLFGAWFQTVETDEGIYIKKVFSASTGKGIIFLPFSEFNIQRKTGFLVVTEKAERVSNSL